MNVAMFAIPNENFQVCKKQATEMAKFANRILWQKSLVLRIRQKRGKSGKAR